MSEPAKDLDNQRRVSPEKSIGRQDWSTWPTYERADLGLRNFWYPLTWSKDVGSKPKSVKILGETVMLIRDGGVVAALSDRCPHRGVPLSLGTQEFPGTITCPYHGWTYGLDDGVLKAAITDGPDSPLCGRVAVKKYPTEERLGLIWIFVGDDENPVPPVEVDIPDELLQHATTIGGRIYPGRDGNWRYAAENGFDEGHAKFLHRNSVWAGFRQLPVWNETKVVRTNDDVWVTRKQEAVHWEADFPGLGTWSQAAWWKLSKTAARPEQDRRVDPMIASLKLPAKASVRLPYILRIAYPMYIHYEWAVPEDENRHRYIQLLVSFKQGIGKQVFKLKYLTFIRWAFHGQFTGQDAWMVDVMDCPPERLYRPDKSVIEFRRLVEKQNREAGYVPSPVEDTPSTRVSES
jgi:phenylpropionate dioxygenase-like ring-hydroxylating dioxygenase large terminal subunit